MNVAKEWFYRNRFARLVGLSPRARELWDVLLWFNNEKCWMPDFYVDDDRLMKEMGLSRTKLYQLKKELQKLKSGVQEGYGRQDRKKVYERHRRYGIKKE